MPNGTTTLLLKLLLIAVLVFSSAAQARSRDRAPSVTLEVQSSSIMMRALVRKHFISLINHYARHPLLEDTGKHPYRLVVKLAGENTGKTNTSADRYQTANRVLVEMKVDLVKDKGKSVWGWEGFAEQRTAERAVMIIAKELAREMKRERLLDKDYYRGRDDSD